jgi:hypothetical protein
MRADDRRAHHRRCGAQHGIVLARVRPGHRATVIDISAGGVLVEVSQRLLPGAAVNLQFETAHHQTAVRGRVVRCAVVHLQSSSVSYHAAIAFEYPIPAGERHSTFGERVDASQGAV